MGEGIVGWRKVEWEGKGKSKGKSKGSRREVEGERMLEWVSGGCLVRMVIPQDFLGVVRSKALDKGAVSFTRLVEVYILDKTT